MRLDRLWPLLVLLLVLLDQWLKHQVASRLALGERVLLLPFLELTRAHNHGAAFSFLSDAGGWQRWMFIALAAAVCAGIAHWLQRRPGAALLLRLGLVLILAGALGNLVDRIAWGYVIDFVLVHLGSYPFPAFNLADSAITVGAVLVILDGFRPQRQSLD